MTQINIGLEQIRQLERLHQQTIPHDFLDENQHVNVQYYVHLAEKGMGALLRRVGLGERYAAADEIGNFALEQHIRYLSEILVNDQVSVQVRLIEVAPKRLYSMAFLVNDSRGELASTVEVVMMNVDIARRRGAPFPPSARAALEAMLALHQALPWSPPVCGVMRA